ncbi:MAG: DUF86 domain-containing protein, partial [Sedimenticolaceae bacterium]
RKGWNTFSNARSIWLPKTTWAIPTFVSAFKANVRICMYGDAAKLIWDAQQALQRIQRFVARKDFAAYQTDELLRSAVERQFEILGEALNQLSRLDPNMAEKIPDLPRIVAFRNILIHGYASVDDRLVWGVVESRLEPLLDVIAALLSED